jgi:hypothetical protein
LVCFLTIEKKQNFNLGGAGNYYGFKQTFKATPMIAVRPEHEDSGKSSFSVSSFFVGFHGA